MGLTSIPATIWCRLVQPAAACRYVPHAGARKLNIVVNAGFVFYQRDSTGRLMNKYLFDQSKRPLARLTATATLCLSYQFNPAAGNKKSTVPREPGARQRPCPG